MSDTARSPAIPLSARNPRIKRLRRLVRQTKARSVERAFVVDGPTLVGEALASPADVEAVFVGGESGLALLRSAAADRGISLDDIPTDLKLYVVDESVLASILDPANPRPLAAIVATPDYALSDVAADLPILVAVELGDPGNLGTAVRTAEAAGLGAVALVGHSVDHLGPKAVRASAGSVLRMPVIDLGGIDEAVAAIRADGRPLVATVVDPSAPSYDQLDLRSAAIAVGNEPHGLRPAFVEQADAVVTIPMAAGVESLNVGAAAAVLAFEVARQRRNDCGGGPVAP